MSYIWMWIVVSIAFGLGYIACGLFATFKVVGARRTMDRQLAVILKLNAIIASQEAIIAGKQAIIEQLETARAATRGSGSP